MRLPLLTSPRTEVVYECRTCGTTVEDENDSCPYCSLSRIVRYEVA